MELDWVFLPRGIPKEQADMGSAHTDFRWQTSDSGAAKSNMSLPELLKWCQTSSLDGAEAAIQATSDSFMPLRLVRVELVQLEQSPCLLAKRYMENEEAHNLFPDDWNLAEDEWNSMSGFLSGRTFSIHC